MRAEVQTHPAEAEAFSFLGVALDNQKKFAEAETAHRRALALAPRSNSILDKYATHQLSTGDEAGARKTFTQALALIPADGYANLQLGQLALKAKNGPEALSYLNRLSAVQQNEPDVVIDRIVAFELSGNRREAGKLEALLLQKPDADVLYSLAYVYDGLNQPEATLRILLHAAQRAPTRPDIQKSLATAAGNLGDYKQALAAWDQYVKLAPNDDTARRERGFAASHAGQRETGIADLRWYVARHADDAEAWCELGIAENSQDLSTGMSSLDKAIALKPDFAIALSARGNLYYRRGDSKTALPDLERAADLTPNDAMFQYRLGQVYLALDRLNDAISRFRRAVELAPNDYTANFHLANALAEAGQTAESDAILKRLQPR